MHPLPAPLLVAALAMVGGGVRAQQPPAMPDTTRHGAPISDRAATLAGTWELAVDGRSVACRVILRAQKSDKGAYFLGMPPACRHAMPSLAKVGRWGLPDAAHMTLDDPAGTTLLTLVAAGDGFVGREGAHAFALTRVGPGTAAAAPLDGPTDAAIVPVRHAAAPEPATSPTRIATDKPVDVAGRYAVMREKRDTGCMLTLDDARAKAGGERAQLAPGCRDQGIVIFDPVGWRLVKGTLVLTARAGHTTRLEKIEEGRWAKDTKDGGKPLGLKRL